MLRFTFLSIFLLLVAAQGKDRCENTGIFTFGKCPDVDDGISNEFFFNCAGLAQFGCVIKPSATTPGKWRCSLDLAAVGTNTVCPGDTIVFDGLNINTNKIVSYFLDLNAPPLLTDFYLLSDTTGSMTAAIADVQAKFRQIIDELSEPGTDVAFGVGQYRDETQLTNGFQNLQSITTVEADSLAAVNGLAAEGGGDPAEAILVALNEISTSGDIGWRIGSRRIVVYFGDHPGHEPSCIAGSPDALTRNSVGDALKNKQITVIGINFGEKLLDGATESFGCGGASATPAGQATHITTVTGGLFREAAAASDVVTTIKSALRDLPRKYEVDETACEDTLVSTFNPLSPWLVNPGESATVKHTMELKNRICETGGSFKCTFKFSDYGGELPGTSLEFVNVKGCTER